jgi:RND family efflux transporter MFP subunit
MRRWFTRLVLPGFALSGTVFAVVFSTVIATPQSPEPNQLSMPAESRFLSTVSGSGLIEASSRNVVIGSFLSGIVDRVSVVEGQWVRAGEPLFALDRRAAEADLIVAEHDVRAAEAAVNEAMAELADRDDQLKRREKLEVGVVVSADTLARLQFASRTARAQVAAAQAAVEVARARVASARVTLERLTVRASIDGRVLKVNVRPGEFVVAGPMVDPPVLLGNDALLHVRVQVDENDVWRLTPGAAAEAVIRGNRDLRFPVTFVRIEPYVLPKRSLTGETAERVDTRILEVIYKFDPSGLPIYIGQQVDVFIEAKRLPGS